MKKRKVYMGMVLLPLLLGAVIVYASSVGTASLSAGDSLVLILNKIPVLKNMVDASGISGVYETIIWEVRLPRVLLAALAGGALGVVGAAFQGIFRNPLADPYVLGVSSGAALGATIAMMFGVQIELAGLGSIGAAAFLCALITVFCIYQVSYMGGIPSMTNMLLAGTAISTLLSSMISLLITFNRGSLERVYMWTLGSFNAATWGKVQFMGAFLLIGSVVLWIFAQELNLMLTGEDNAKSLGVSIKRVRIVIIVTSSLLVAAAVSVSGVVGFVGLVVPHCVRIIFGVDYRYLIPFSMVSGAMFTVFCDTIARTAAAPTEIPVGVVTALFGAPFFLYLLFKQGRKKV